jgi:hypothetical protein
MGACKIEKSFWKIDVAVLKDTNLKIHNHVDKFQSLH